MINKPLHVGGVIGLIIVLLSLFTVHRQVSSLGENYLLTEQLDRHEKVLAHQAGNPWQYRLLSEWLVRECLPLPEVKEYSERVPQTFFILRMIQNALIFLLSFFYLRQLHIEQFWSVMGLGILGWSLSYALYDSDLSFNTYFDIIFYLLAALLILRKYDWGLPILMIFASLNRETSALIPFLYLGYQLRESDLTGLKLKTWVIFGISMVNYLFVFILLRLSYPAQTVIKPYGIEPGLEMLFHNLSQLRSYYNLFATFGIFPLLSFLNYPKWPTELKIFSWVLIPLWIIVHLFGGIIAETRLFLVPFVLIILPGIFVARTPLAQNTP